MMMRLLVVLVVLKLKVMEVLISWMYQKKSIKIQIKSGQLNNSNNIKKLKFLISKARKAFICLKQAFTKALILWHFNPKYYTQIKPMYQTIP